MSAPEIEVEEVGDDSQDRLLAYQIFLLLRERQKEPANKCEPLRVLGHVMLFISQDSIKTKRALEEAVDEALRKKG